MIKKIKNTMGNAISTVISFAIAHYILMEIKKELDLFVPIKEKKELNLFWVIVISMILSVIINVIYICLIK